jgi:hypothetical protein
VPATSFFAVPFAAYADAVLASAVLAALYAAFVAAAFAVLVAVFVAVFAIVLYDSLSNLEVLALAHATSTAIL